MSACYPPPRTLYTSLFLAALLFLVNPAHAQDFTTPQHPLFTSPVRELPEKPFDQEHIRLALRFEPASGQIYGTAKLRIRPNDVTRDRLYLHAEDLDIYSVQVGVLDSLTVSAAYSDSAAGILAIALDSLQVKGVPFEVQITYLARPNTGLSFRSLSSGNTSEGLHIWTDGAPSHMRHWLPLIPHGADRVTSELITTVPPGLTVWSNGRLIEQLETEDGMTLFHYVQDQPHSLRDIGFFAGYFTVDSSAVTLSNGYSLPVRYWSPTGKAEYASASYDEIPDILSFYSEYLDFTYPWPSYAALVLDELYLEDRSLTGLSVFNDRILKDERAYLDNPETLRLATSVARQWFTHLIDVDFEADLWLVEGVAAYLGLLYLKSTLGDVAYALRLHEYADQYFEESLEYRRPLVWNQWEYPSQLKDDHSTAKGVWIMHSLHESLGDDTFQEFIRLFTREQAFKTTNTDAFLASLDAFSGQSFSAFFDDWIYSAGHPELHVDYRFDLVSESLYVAIDQKQEGFLVPSAYNLDLDIETYSISGPERQSIRIESEDQLHAVPLPMKPRYVIIGPDQPYLMRLKTEQEASSWIAQLRYATHPISQLRAIEALHSYTSDPALLIGLQSALRSRPSPAVRAAIIKLIAQLPHSEATQRTIIDAFEDESIQVKQAVLRALSAYENTSELTVIAMEAAQASESYVLQAEAVYTLSKINAPGAFGIVQSGLITDSHRDIIRQKALHALLVLGDLSTQQRYNIANEHTLTSYSTEARLAAIHVLVELASLGHKRSKRRLVALLGDKDPAIRYAVLDVFSRIGNDDDLDSLRDFLEDEYETHIILKGNQAIQYIESQQEAPTSP